MTFGRAGLAATVLILTSTVAAKPMSLDLDRSLELAFENSEQLRIASLEVGKAANQVAEARSGVFPQVSTSVEYSRFVDSPIIATPIGDFPVKRNWDLSVEARVTQILWAFGRVSNAIDAARIFKGLSELSLEQAQNQIASQVKALYFAALMAEKTLSITQASLDNVKGNQEALRRRFSRGRIPQYDNLKMETDIALRLPQVIEAEQELLNIKAKLKFLLGLPQDQEVKIAGDWPERGPLQGAEQVLEEIYASNLQLRQLESQQSLYEKQSQNERASRYPTIAAFAYYQKAGTSDRYYIGGSDLNDTAAIGVQVSYDVWTGGRRAARLASSLKDERITGEHRAQLQRSLASEVASIASNLESLERNLKASQRAQTLAQQAYEMTRTRYEGGQASQVELNDAEMNLTGSRLNTELILFNRQMEWVKLEELSAQIR